MKYALIALLILSLVLGMCLLCLNLLEDTTEQVTETLKLALDAAARKDFPVALFHVQHAQEQWEKTEGLYGVLLNHSETDEITFLLSALMVCAEQPVAEELQYRCAELIAMLEHIAEMEKPYYYNIF